METYSVEAFITHAEQHPGRIWCLDGKITHKDQEINLNFHGALTQFKLWLEEILTPKSQSLLQITVRGDYSAFGEECAFTKEQVIQRAREAYKTGKNTFNSITHTRGSQIQAIKQIRNDLQVDLKEALDFMRRYPEIIGA